VDINSKIYVAGHTGMVGSAIVRKLKNDGFNNFTFRTHDELDLINQNEVIEFFNRETIDIVFIAAAKVGGINANNTYRGQFLYQNLMIQSNLIHAAHQIGVKKLMFLGSACIYPRDSSQPIKEENLLTDKLEYTNEPYAIAKIAGIKLCENYYHQYGDNFMSVMPNNLYGSNDNFDLKNSHVLPALMRKFHEGKIKNNKSVEVWGSGNPLREFLHVDDLANACIYLMNKIDADDLYSNGISHINIGSGEEISIKELAIMIKNVVGYQGDLFFNSDYPDGTPRKLLDVSRLNEMGWKSEIKLNEGLKSVYKWYLETRTD
jgi:GDP-L-fucose synthase